MSGYLRIGELSRRTGVSPELLRAWESRYGLLEPARSSGGFRLYSDLDAARVLKTKELIAQGISAAEAARRALAASAPPAQVGSASLATDISLRLTVALDGFDETAAHEAIDELFSRFSVETALRDVVLPYLRRLGDKWEAGEISVGQEHFASNLIRGRLLGLARGWGSAVGPTVLLACPPGEEHELGLMVFGIVAARKGWRVVYLGPNAPFETIEATAREIHPVLVVLASVVRDRLAGHEDELRSLAAVAPVAVGGELSAEDVERAGARFLDADPVTAALSVAG